MLNGKVIIVDSENLKDEFSSLVMSFSLPPSGALF